MPLQLNTLKESTPFLQYYQPYQLPQGTVLSETVDNMISYSLVLSSPSTLRYQLGAENTYGATFTIKNITTNAILDIKIEQNKQVFLISSDTLTFALNPNETRSFIFELNKEYLNSISRNLQFLATLDITVSNRKNGTVVLTSINTNRLTQETLPAIIEVV